MTLEESFGQLEQFPTEAEVLADARRRSVHARRSHRRQLLRRIPTVLIALRRVMCRAIARALSAAAARVGVICRAISRVVFIVVVRSGAMTRWPAVPHPRRSVLALTLVSFGSGLLVGSFLHRSDASRASVEVAVAARPQFKAAIRAPAPVITESAAIQAVPVSTSLKIAATPSRISARPVAPPPASVEPRIAVQHVDAAARVSAATTATNRRTAPRALGYLGSLVVDSRPAGAHVFVNGRSAGTTPLVLKDQPAGSRAVRLSLDGYAPWTSVVQIIAGREVRVSTALKSADRLD